MESSGAVGMAVMALSEQEIELKRAYGFVDQNETEKFTIETVRT